MIITFNDSSFNIDKQIEDQSLELENVEEYQII